MIGVEHPGCCVGDDLRRVGFPPRIIIPLPNRGIDFAVCLQPIVVPATSRVHTETGGKDEEAKEAKKSIHNGRK
jgi:hypothetical protein